MSFCPVVSSKFPLKNRNWRMLAAVLICLVSGSIIRAEEPAEAPTKAPLPLTRVVLFSSSVGFFEHSGKVSGNQQIPFSFKTADLNDLLKSLVVQDRDGGLVTTVNYGSPEPVAKTLSTFAIDLTDSPSLADIFDQLRGEPVRLTVPEPVTGTIVGVETRSVLIGDKEFPNTEVVNLRTEDGVQSVRVEGIRTTKFLNPKIDHDFQQALELLASARGSDQKQVKLDFRGKGERSVSIGYIQEAPVWKTTYRLVLKEKGPPLLQGWAIVENTTAADWKDVQLSLVSGRPISFVMDLYQPMFMARPLVTPEQHASLRPRVHDQDLADAARQLAEAANRPKQSGDIAGGGRRGGMGGGMGGGGGFGGGMGGGFAGGGGFFGGGRVGSGDGDDQIEPGAGVQAAATTEDVGELFRYSIKDPVTLARNESAMLPIVNGDVQAEKVAIYNPATHAKHPLSAVRLTNSTGLHLLQGPITLFDGGEYAGDARIEDVSPGATRIVSYALDLETEIVSESKPEKLTTTALQIAKGGLHLQHKARRETSFVIKNSSADEKQVLLERPISSGWTVVEPANPETTRSLHRFQVAAAPGKATTLVVVEEEERGETLVLAKLDLARIEMLLQLPVASAEAKKSLKQTIDLRSAVSAAQSKVREVDSDLLGLGAEQERLRHNLESVNASKFDQLAAEADKQAGRDLLKRFLTKLSAVESRIEALETKRESLAKELAAAELAYEAFLGQPSAAEKPKRTAKPAEDPFE